MCSPRGLGYGGASAVVGPRLWWDLSLDVRWGGSRGLGGYRSRGLPAWGPGQEVGPAGRVLTLSE